MLLQAAASSRRCNSMQASPRIRSAAGCCLHAPAGKLKENEVRRAIQIRNIVTSLGPAYIKLGCARWAG